MKKTQTLILVLLCLGLLFACTKPSHSDNKNATESSIPQTKTKNTLKKSQIINVAAKESNSINIVPMVYNSGETTGIVQGDSIQTAQTMNLSIPKTWEKVEGGSDNAYKVSKDAKEAIVDIWTLPPLQEDKEDKILGIKWLSSDEVLKKYFKEQGEKAEIFKKKIGKVEYSVATTNISEGNKTIVTYCTISDEGNFSSAAVMTNVIMYDKMAIKNKLSILEEVEGMLSKLDIKVN